MEAQLSVFYNALMFALVGKNKGMMSKLTNQATGAPDPFLVALQNWENDFTPLGLSDATLIWEKSTGQREGAGLSVEVDLLRLTDRGFIMYKGTGFSNGLIYPLAVSQLWVHGKADKDVKALTDNFNSAISTNMSFEAIIIRDLLVQISATIISDMII